MSDHIWEGDRQAAYIKNGYAIDVNGRKRYRVDGDKLLHLDTGEVVGHLSQLGKPGTVSKTGLFD